MTCYNRITYGALKGFPGSSAGKESPCNSGDAGLIPRWGSSFGEGIGNPLQYSWASLVAQTVKEKLTCGVEDLGSIPGSGRFPGGGHGNPLQYSCLENPWTESLIGYSPWGCKQSDTTERLSLTQRTQLGLPWWLSGKESACSAGDP